MTSNNYGSSIFPEFPLLFGGSSREPNGGTVYALLMKILSSTRKWLRDSVALTCATAVLVAGVPEGCLEDPLLLAAALARLGATAARRQGAAPGSDENGPQPSRNHLARPLPLGLMQPLWTHWPKPANRKMLFAQPERCAEYAT